MEDARTDVQRYEKTLDQLLDPDLMMATYEDVVEMLRTLNKKKSEDYNSDEITFSDYFPDACRDLWLTVHGKVLRLRSLVGREGGVRVPNFETISDSAIDLAAYAIWMVVMSRHIDRSQE